jgi:anti-sigma-K factor RskA
VLAAAAAAVLVAVAGAVWLASTPPSPTVLATASLDALPEWPSASGSARLERLADGSRVIQVTLDSPADPDGFREAWLITGDAGALVSLGVMSEGTATFAVPDGIDTSRYELVDVSEEAFDGDPAHSGDSIVRGPLRPL